MKAIGAPFEELIVTAWNSGWLGGGLFEGLSEPLLVSGIMNQSSPEKTCESKKSARIG
ncbi:MAG: hypothetical protein QM771_11760 [Nitrospira sp.]